MVHLQYHLFHWTNKNRVLPLDTDFLGDNTKYMLTYLYIDPLVFVQPRENEDPTCMRKIIYFPKEKNPENGILLKIYFLPKVLHFKKQLPGPLTPCIFPRRKTTIRSDSLNLETSLYRTDTGHHKCRGCLFYSSLKVSFCVLELKETCLYS